MPRKRAKSDPDKDGLLVEKLKVFGIVHWRGIVCFATPIIFISLLPPFPPAKYQWCAYTLAIMAVYWVTECIPLPVTAFLPVIIFPLTGIMSTTETCKCYINDTVIMFLGSLMMANAVEQSGLHKRIALNVISIIGYSHYKLLGAVCLITMFISMWITNTAATTLMVPIVFALLRVFEYNRLFRIYEKNDSGEQVATDMAACYFCAITFSATIGGIGTLIGTATNLAFKGLFQTAYPLAPDLLSFPLFSAFAIPYMLALIVCLYAYLVFVYFGLFRSKSEAAKKAKFPQWAETAAKKSVEKDLKDLGDLTFWEFMVILLFGGAMIMFFTRSPQIFTGWGDNITDHFGLEDYKFVRDSACAMLIVFLMLLLPSNMSFCKNLTAKNMEDLPKKPIGSVLNWKELDAVLPYSFMFLLGGGSALAAGAKPEHSDLNGEIGRMLIKLSDLHNIGIILIIIMFTVLITNFASNVAIASVICPIAMQLANEINQNPLWYNIAAGFSASFCFMLPVGTPGNLIVQSSAKVSTRKMIIAGFGPTISTIILTWLFVFYYAPVIWPVLTTLPDWVGKVPVAEGGEGGGGGEEAAD